MKIKQLQVKNLPCSCLRLLFTYERFAVDAVMPLLVDDAIVGVITNNHSLSLSPTIRCRCWCSHQQSDAIVAVDAVVGVITSNPILLLVTTPTMATMARAFTSRSSPERLPKRTLPERVLRSARRGPYSIWQHNPRSICR
jgi:hypothetical protein